MSSYNSDMIIADIDAMEAFLLVANNIKDELFSQIHQIERQYRRLTGWEDNIQQRTGEILDKIEKQSEILADEIENLNRNFEDLVDDLKDYNNPNLGKFGRL